MRKVIFPLFICLLLTGCHKKDFKYIALGILNPAISGGGSGNDQDIQEMLDEQAASASMTKAATPPTLTQQTACDPNDTDGDPYDDICDGNPSDPNPK